LKDQTLLKRKFGREQKKIDGVGAGEVLPTHLVNLFALHPMNVQKALCCNTGSTEVCRNFRDSWVFVKEGLTVVFFTIKHPNFQDACLTTFSSPTGPNPARSFSPFFSLTLPQV